MIEKIANNLQENLLKYYKENYHAINKEWCKSVVDLREKSFNVLEQNGLPIKKNEKWRNTDLSDLYQQSFNFEEEKADYSKSVDEMFVCEVHDFDTYAFSMLNGWNYSKKNNQLTVLENGVIFGSILQAQRIYPELFEAHFNKTAKSDIHGLTAANAALFRDGMFIYIPDDVVVDKAIQLINMNNREDNLMINTRNLIVLGKNSNLSFLHCDDSVNHSSSFINTVTEIIIGENAHFNLYKLQNLNDATTLVNSTFIIQERSSSSKVNVITYNGGLIRNELFVDLLGEGADADLNGVYLMDKKQHIDNQVFVNHAVPNCTSSELFKGVLDDQASGVFNGYIYVARNAQKTAAFQQNNNILLSSDAKIDTQPFLEIYADDVKCSHGATVGQLDTEALFYMKQRGIGHNDAMLLLMFAFTAEVTSKIGIEPLRLSIEDMIKKRLRGELSICETCVLHCSIPNKPIEFDIDLSKI